MLVGDVSGKVDVASVGIDDITPAQFMETCKITIQYPTANSTKLTTSLYSSYVSGNTLQFTIVNGKGKAIPFGNIKGIIITYVDGHVYSSPSVNKSVAGMGNSWLSRAELDDNITSITFTGYYF